MTQNAAALVLGVDPGTAVTGFGVVERDQRGRVTLVECGVIRTSPAQPLPARIRAVYRVGVNEWNGTQSLQLIVEHWQPA